MNLVFCFGFSAASFRIPVLGLIVGWTYVLGLKSTKELSMKVVFESDAPQGETLREMAIGRVTFAMRRLSWLVPRARVQMSDVNGPRGGVDKRCQIELKTDTSGTVVVTAMARDWRTALDSALARASHVLMRRSQRRQSFSRQRATLRLAQGGAT